ncbi:Rubber oxygenase [Frankliniella fusca]|uniref:Rubber oxygenase n=1 Tax=Frankliniella fusca TaxID=407009 RepID=A0AAE1HMZ4_9NEOP|nr:Rubber oxygenase [Frankliniella fusca]
MGFSSSNSSSHASVEPESAPVRRESRQSGGSGGDDPDSSADSLLYILDTEAAHTYLEDADADNSQESLPAWFDEARYKRGAQVFELKILVLTKQSGQPDKAFRRYVDTIRHMLFWYRTDIGDPKSQARESLAVVRRHHLRGSAAARRAGLPGISQLDMILTQFAFCGFALLRRKECNIDVSDREILDFAHVWRTIGFLIGIDERYNICQFDTDLSCTVRVFEGICSKWLAPALITPPKEFAPMSRALLDGTWCMMPVVEYTSYLNYTQERAGVPEDLRCKTTKTGSILLALLHFIPNSLKWPAVGQLCRIYHNVNMHFSLFMSTYYPLLAWYSFPNNSNTQYRKLISKEL